MMVLVLISVTPPRPNLKASQPEKNAINRIGPQSNSIGLEFFRLVNHSRLNSRNIQFLRICEISKSMRRRIIPPMIQVWSRILTQRHLKGKIDRWSQMNISWQRNSWRNMAASLPSSGRISPSEHTKWRCSGGHGDSRTTQGRKGSRSSCIVNILEKSGVWLSKAPPAAGLRNRLVLDIVRGGARISHFMIE